MTDENFPSMPTSKRVGLGAAHFECGLRTSLAAPAAAFFAGVVLLWMHSFEPRSSGQGVVGLVVALAGALELVVAPVALYRLSKHRVLRTPRNVVVTGAGAAVIAVIVAFMLAVMIRTT